MIYCMPMLLLHVGWCLPLPIPSSKISLPTQKLTSYPTLKLTIHMLPYPKTQPKTHSPHASLPKNSTKNSQPTCYPYQKHTRETMSSPSKVVGWECGACAYTNKDATCCNCLAGLVAHFLGGVLRGVHGNAVDEAVFCHKARNGCFLGRESLVGESRIQLAGLSDEA